MSARCLIDCVGPVEPAVSRWPKYLYALTLVPVSTAIVLCGLGAVGKVLALMLALAILQWEWRRQPKVSVLEFSPQQIRFQLCEGRTLQVEAPFRCMVTTGFVSVHVPELAGGWLTLFADQLESQRFRQLRRVLWLARR